MKRGAVFAGLAGAFLTFLGFLFIVPISVSWLQATDARYDRTELFVGSQAGAYTLDDRYTWNSGSSRMIQYSTTIIRMKPPESIRLDPSMLPGRFRIGEVKFDSGFRTVVLGPKEIADRLFSLNNAKITQITDEWIEFEGLNRDPNFSLLVPPEIRALNWYGAVMAGFVGMLLGILSWLLWRFLIYPDFGHRLRRTLQKYSAVAFYSALVIVCAALISLQLRVAEVTPPLQGPDEIVHMANSYDGFHRALGGAEGCPLVWSELLDIFDLFIDMRLRYTVQVDDERIAEITQLRQTPTLADKHDLARLGESSCTLTNLFHGTVFNAPAFLAATTNQNLRPIDYLASVRLGNILTALVLTAFVGLIVIKGRFVFEGLWSVDANVLRIALGLSLLLYLLIPQNIFMTSMISRESYMLPLGIFTFISIFFRMPWLTSAGLILAVYAFWPRRAPYLLPVVFVVMVYASVWMANRQGQIKWLALPIVPILGVFVLTPALLLLIAQVEHWMPFRVPDHLMVMDNFFHFHIFSLEIIPRLLSFSVFESPSYFGKLGSLDTLIAPWLIIFFHYLIVAALGVAAAGWLLSIFRRWDLPSHFKADTSMLLLQAGYAFAVLLMMTMVTYAGYQVYSSPERGWGWGVQGRYFLPIYFPLVAYAFLLALSPWWYNAKNSDGIQLRSFIIAVGFLIILIAIFGFASGYVTLDALISRYYLDDAVFQQFMNWVKEG